MKMYFFFGALMISLAASAQDSTYKELAGKYKFPSGSVVDEAIVTIENGVVTMNSTAGVSVLEKIKGDTFNVVSFSGIAIFKRNEAKKITGVHVDASGYVLDGVKEETSVAGATGLEQANIADDKWIEPQIKTREKIAGKGLFTALK